MLKNCVICGTQIEIAAPNQKYCPACRHKAQLAQQKAWREGKSATPMGVCRCCGRPMRKLSPDQTMHRKCDPGYNSHKKAVYQYKFKLPKKDGQNPPAYSIAQIEAKARELGTTYGKVVDGIRSGKISME